MAVVGPAEVCGAAVIVVGGDGGGAPWGKSLVHTAHTVKIIWEAKFRHLLVIEEYAHSSIFSK